MPATSREILKLLDRLEGPIARGFRDAVAATVSRSRLNALIAALEVGDLDRAMAAVGYRQASWSHLTESIRNAYLEAGIFTIATDVPKKFGMLFNIANPRAEQWLRQHSSKLVTLINAEQREAIRVVLEAGMAMGRNPRSIGLDIIGRVSQQTGRRAGGIVGLNGPQTKYLMNAQDELRNLDANYFTRKLRDRRFDSIVQKAIDSGTPLSQADINRIAGRYADRLLQLRGETIGRTEALQSLNQGAYEALRQVVDEGLASPDAIKLIWDSSGDSRTRASHVAMDGQERDVEEPFTTGSGISLMHPGDWSMGAPAEEIINCRCVVKHDIDFIAVEFGA